MAVWWQLDIGVLRFDRSSLHFRFRHVGICCSEEKKPISFTQNGCLIVCSGPASHVLLGDLNYGSSTDDSQPRQYRIVDRIKHERFKYPSKYDDIALVKIDGPVQLNNYIRPACLPLSPSIDSKNVIASGWGRVNYKSDVSEHLQKVVLEIFTHQECNLSYFNEIGRQLKRGIVDETQLCAGSHIDQKDTCQVSPKFPQCKLTDGSETTVSFSVDQLN